MVVSIREQAHEIVEHISEDRLAEIISFLDYLSVKEEVQATDEMGDNSKMPGPFQKGLTACQMNDSIDFESINVEV
jgi:hypothetical protein